MKRFFNIFRNFYTPLAALVLLNIIVRVQRWYMMPSYVTGDTTLLVWMAESILSNGKAMWFLHPISATGFVEYSYPAGVPLLLATTSAITGLTRVDLLYSVSLFYIFLTILAGYNLGNEFSGNSTIALFTAFAISLSSGFVCYTATSGSSSGRILLIIFLSMAIYLLLKLERTSDHRYVPVVLIITFVTLISHRVSLCLLIVFLAYGLAKIANKGFSCISDKRQCLLRGYFKFIYMGIFLIFFAFIYSPWYPLQRYLVLLQNGLFISGTSPICMTLNMVIDYAAFINPIIVLFSIVGVIRVLKSETINFNNFFLLFILLGFAPVLAFSRYASLAIIPLVAILFGWGLYELVVRSEYISRWKSATFSVVIVLAIAALLIYVTPLKLLLFYNQTLNENGPHIIDTSNYIKTENIDNIQAENRFIARNYMLYSEKPIFPLEGPSYPVFYSKEFENVSFKYWLRVGNGKHIWDLNNEISEFDIDSKYRIVHQEKPGGFVEIIYDNSFERIITK